MFWGAWEPGEIRPKNSRDKFAQDFAENYEGTFPNIKAFNPNPLCRASGSTISWIKTTNENKRICFREPCVDFGQDGLLIRSESLDGPPEQRKRNWRPDTNTWWTSGLLVLWGHFEVNTSRLCLSFVVIFSKQALLVLRVVQTGGTDFAGYNKCGFFTASPLTCLAYCAEVLGLHPVLHIALCEVWWDQPSSWVSECSNHALVGCIYFPPFAPGIVEANFLNLSRLESSLARFTLNEVSNQSFQSTPVNLNRFRFQLNQLRRDMLRAGWRRKGTPNQNVGCKRIILDRKDTLLIRKHMLQVANM